jgi:hypothetical protein
MQYLWRMTTGRSGSAAAELTREALYELVWAEPMRTVAQGFGLSDVGLAKKCRRMNIPVPESSSKPLEARLNDFVLTLVWEANEDRERHDRFTADELRRQVEAARLQAERDRLGALEARCAAEAARHRILVQQASSWVRSREIREYLAAVRAKLAEQPQIENGRLIADWLDWAEAHASELDPLNHSAVELVLMCGPAPGDPR